jgi:hypothetical protein
MYRALLASHSAAFLAFAALCSPDGARVPVLLSSRIGVEAASITWTSFSCECSQTLVGLEAGDIMSLPLGDGTSIANSPSTAIALSTNVSFDFPEFFDLEKRVLREDSLLRTGREIVSSALLARLLIIVPMLKDGRRGSGSILEEVDSQ